MAEFRINAFHNEFLPEVRGACMPSSPSPRRGPDRSTPGPAPATEERSELLIVDTSGSMNGKKLRSVKEATAAAIDCIPDGVRFGIITGNHKAEVAYPSSPPLATSSPESRGAAKEAVKKFEAGGGTAIGSWIRLAAQVLGDATGHPPCDPAHGRQERERGPWGLRGEPARRRGRVPVRLPRCRAPTGTSRSCNRWRPLFWVISTSSPNRRGSPRTSRT